MEQSAGRAAQDDVSAEPGRLAAAVEQAGLPEPWQVEFHPVRPVAVVTPVHKMSTLQEQGCTGYHGGLLQENTVG